MQTKFNIGDKVKILDGNNIDGYVGGWAPRMLDRFIGEVGTIESIKITKHGIGYVVEEIPLIFDERGLKPASNGDERATCGDDLWLCALLALL
jgi:hypothetical protein